MISKTIGFRGSNHFQTNPNCFQGLEMPSMLKKANCNLLGLRVQFIHLAGPLGRSYGISWDAPVSKPQQFGEQVWKSQNSQQPGKVHTKLYQERIQKQKLSRSWWSNKRHTSEMNASTSCFAFTGVFPFLHGSKSLAVWNLSTGNSEKKQK